MGGVERGAVGSAVSGAVSSVGGVVGSVVSGAVGSVGGAVGSVGVYVALGGVRRE